ncbi:MAG: hypothetical protein NZ602_13665 [Thermoguttaceae bacterium]|nr:hypothetical protein [Thermoguttaceae bacterium]MDW8039261.1 hypothetical protein [Thermoguttaceae bacterium]
MSQYLSWGAHWRSFWGAWKAHPRLAWGPVVILVVLGGIYVGVVPPKWRATQAFLVREEATTSTRLGRFDSGDALKTAQETLLELARNRSVVAEALRRVGPPHKQTRLVPMERSWQNTPIEKGTSPLDGVEKRPLGSAPNPDGIKPSPLEEQHSPLFEEPWPTEKDIRRLQEAVTVTAPKGAEFGKTEVIYLTVIAETRTRALALVQALSEALQRYSQQLRDRKAQSIVAELEEQVRLAQSALDQATSRLQQMERQVGSDLGELRNLNDSGRGDSNLRTLLTQINEELRKVQGSLAAKTQLRHLLRSAQEDPQSLVGAPNEMLDSLPTLRKLKEGLVEAQLRTAQVLGKMSLEHPLAQAAMAAEQEVRDRLRQELVSATEGLEADLKVESARVEKLQQQLAEVQERLDRLAGLRAEYNNLVNDVRQKSEILDRATKALAEAKAAQASAKSTSLLTPLEGPQADPRPLGPGPLVILASCLVGGWLIGAGLVFLIYPPPDGQGRRWTDRLRFGRRATDPPIGRRATDYLPQGMPGGLPLGATALPPGTASGSPYPSVPSGAIVGQPYGRRATDFPRLPEWVSQNTPPIWIAGGQPVGFPIPSAVPGVAAIPPGQSSFGQQVSAPEATALTPSTAADSSEPCRSSAELPVPLVERRSGQDRRQVR